MKKKITVLILATMFLVMAIAVSAGKPVCGDGKLHSSEECDDGNLINGDGCSDQCLIEGAPTCIDGETRQCGDTDVGECEYGTETCTNGEWGECTGAVYATTEVCDNLDNNCDGSIDESLTQAASNTYGECSSNTEYCSAGTWYSDPENYVPVDETCNGLDDDCDNSIDEDEVCGSEPEGLIYANTGDGFIKYSEGTFSSVDTSSDLNSGYNYLNKNKYSTTRAYMQFDTTNLENVTSIESATLNIKVSSSSINTNNILRLEYLLWDGSLDASDWSINPREVITDSLPGTTTVDQWESIDVTSQLQDAVLTRGESAFSVRIKHDTESSSGNDYMTWYSAEDNGNEPYLDVSFTESPLTYGSLQVSMSGPLDNTVVQQNGVFDIEAIVSCVGDAGDICGLAEAFALYGLTTPDTAISVIPGTSPLYAIGTGLGELVDFGDGFDSSNGDSNNWPAGIDYDPRDDTLWIAHFNSDYVGHWDLAGNQLGDGFYIRSNISNEGLALAPDGTFWIADLYGDDIVHYDASGNELGAYDIGYLGVTNPLGIEYDPTDDTLWVVDEPLDYVFHVDLAGNDLGDGFSYTSLGAESIRGLAYDTSDDTLWLAQGSLPEYEFHPMMVYHVDKNGNDLGDSFDYGSVLGNITLVDGIAEGGVDSSFWLSPYSNDPIQHVGYNTSYAINPQSQTLNAGENFVVDWTVEATSTSGTYEIGVKTSSSETSIADAMSNTATVCIGSC